MSRSDTDTASGDAGTATDGSTLRDRIAAQPRPALRWLALGALLLLPEAGALLDLAFAPVAAVGELLPVGGAFLASIPGDVPTLLSRQTIPNAGYYDGRRWVGTAFGLEPKWAWALRAGLIYAYAFAVLAWLWSGYRRFRRHYRAATWTPRDDVVDRLRGHRWGQFGLLVVCCFLIAAAFAPALGPTTVERNVLDPYSHEISYWDADAGVVETTTVGDANLDSESRGDADENVGPWQYDRYDRFHPFGTTTNGKDLFTFVVAGARVSLTIAVASMLGAALLALALALISAYYRGLTDLLLVLTSDSIQALPLFMLLLLVVAVFQNTRIYEFYDGIPLLIGVFVLVRWPFLWRAIRGPTLRVADQTWIDAARSYGQAPRAIMRKHMAPYVLGYLLVYTSMSLGGIVLSVAGLSFLGLGVDAPTPEWGRLIADGQAYVAGVSWHVSLLPGLLITLVVTGFNALGDGVRDAIDPQSEGGEPAETTTAGGSGA